MTFVSCVYSTIQDSCWQDGRQCVQMACNKAQARQSSLHSPRMPPTKMNMILAHSKPVRVPIFLPTPESNSHDMLSETGMARLGSFLTVWTASRANKALFIFRQRSTNSPSFQRAAGRKLIVVVDFSLNSSQFAPGL